MKKFLRWIATTTLASVMLAGLTSCGGGGVSSDTGNIVGSLAISPGTGTLYAGAAFTFTVAGGTRPYHISSNEQTVIPLANYRLDGNTFTVIPNNPGVVDVGGQEGEVPHRTVILTIRDNAGTQITATYSVLQNFLTGYDMSLAALNCVVGTPPVALPACSGQRSRVFLHPTTNGLIQRNKQLRLSIIEGQFSYVTNEATGTLGPELVVTTDELGNASGQLDFPSTARTQFAKLRVTDVVTGVYRDFNFTISNVAGPLAVTPAAIDLTGGSSAVCGSGISDVIVTGGTPPYFASSTMPSLIAIQPTTLNDNGGSFSLTIFAGSLPNCISGGAVVVRDSSGQTQTVSIDTHPGTTAPLVPLTAQPNTICLADGATTPVLVTGGNNNKVVNVGNPALVSVTPNNWSGATQVVAVAAVGAAPLVPATGTGVTVIFYDGASQALLSVNRKTTCP